MHQSIRAAVQRNADYHAAMADHFSALQGKATNGGGEAQAMSMPSPPPPASGGRRRGSETPSMMAGTRLPSGVPSSDDLAKLIEMHKGAAEQLVALLADDPPQAIAAARATPPVTRRVIPAGARAAGGVRVH